MGAFLSVPGIGSAGQVLADPVAADAEYGDTQCHGTMVDAVVPRGSLGPMLSVAWRGARDLAGLAWRCGCVVLVVGYPNGRYLILYCMSVVPGWSRGDAVH